MKVNRKQQEDLAQQFKKVTNKTDAAVKAFGVACRRFMETDTYKEMMSGLNKLQGRK